MTDQEKKQKESQQRLQNCATELLGVLHKYDCILSINSQVDANGNVNSQIGIMPINREINKVAEPEELENGDNQETG